MFVVGRPKPKKTPRDVVARIHRETVGGLRDPAVKEKLAKFGVEEMVMQPEEFDARIARAGVVRDLALLVKDFPGVRANDLNRN